ncbi:MAG: AtpZ/AtpI family protein [Nitrospirota bacterium]|jgi:ATP synthase protein I
MKPPLKDEDFTDKISKVASELQKARKEKSGFLHYASLIGMGGWLLALPIVAGAYLGHFLDEKTDMGVSWSLTFIILGVAVGIFNIWYFLYRE